MDHRRVILAIVAACPAALLIADATLAQTGDTRPIQVTAAVKASCRFEATPNINFGELDPATAADKTQTVQVSFKCTKGVNYTFSVGDGMNFQGAKARMKSSSGVAYIPYEITPKQQSGNGAGFETATSLTVQGSVKGVDYRNAPVGSYADTVVLSIQP